ncbi:Transmembrane channel 5 [Brachionus plicatilis]|uniref:Transmembrane channel 5 n=1 Tax=Brachionus plicatilis TaxID=10195 RepID=A0A3M7SSS9_BRAPC|nr:Transmembrane channel 5 [Brachionus plicatilis]
MNEAIDFNKFKEDLQKIDNYFEAENYIRNQPLDLNLKRQIYHQNKARLENLTGRNKFNKITRNVIRSQASLEKPLSFLFNKLSNSIQKNLGHETASYFYYSDWLLTWTIISYFPTIFCFVCIPHIIYWVNNYSNVNSMPNDDQIVRNSYCLKSLADFDNFNLTSLVQKSEFLNIIVYGCFPGDSSSDFGYKLDYRSAVVKSISNSYIREIRIQNLNIFSSAIFCSWPFYSNDSKFIKKKRTQIINNLKMLKTGDKSKLRIKRVIAINLLVKFWFAVIGIKKNFSFFLTTNIDEFVSQRRIVLAAFLTIFNYFTPFICKFLSSIENCPKSFESKLNLIRMYLMQHGLLGLIIAYIIINRGECWEDEIAKQIYTFLVFDFALSFFLDIILMMLYRIIVKIVFPYEDIYFNSSYYSINILINQFLFWIGLYFTPYLGFIFGICSIVIYVARVPPNKSENFYQNETNILIMTLVSLFLAFVLTGVFILQFESSKICGPFNNEKYENPYDYLIQFKNYLFNLDIIGFVFRLLLSPGFFAFIMFFSSVLIYTMIANYALNYFQNYRFSSGKTFVPLKLSINSQIDLEETFNESSIEDKSLSANEIGIEIVNQINNFNSRNRPNRRKRINRGAEIIFNNYNEALKSLKKKYHKCFINSKCPPRMHLHCIDENQNFNMLRNQEDHDQSFINSSKRLRKENKNKIIQLFDIKATKRLRLIPYHPALVNNNCFLLLVLIQIFSI